MNGSTTRFDFEGNCFYLRQDYGSYYSIQKIELGCTVLTVPPKAFFQKTNLDNINLRRVACPEEVEKFILLKDSMPIEEDSFAFPHLMILEVDPQNKKYSTDGRCLLTKDGKTLLRYVCLGDSSPLVLPNNLQSIRPWAFTDSKMKQITFPDRKITIGDNAFHNSAWEKERRGIVTVGKTIYSLEAPVKVLDLTGGITPHKDAFQHYSPETILCDEVPTTRFNQGYGISNLLDFPKHLVFTSKVFLPSNKPLLRFAALGSISLQGEHPLYTTRDGILYSKDGKTLLYCPPLKKLKDFQVPEGVTRIAAFAFYQQHYLESIRFPDCVRWIGIGAFTGCKALQKVWLPAGLTTLPDNQMEDEDTEDMKGVFENCCKLTQVSFGKALRSIGDYAFSGCPLRDVELPEGLLRLGIHSLNCCEGTLHLPSSLLFLGLEALSEIQDLYVWEGTGKGLAYAVGESTTIHVESHSASFSFPAPAQFTASGLIQLSEAWDGEGYELATLASCYTYFKEASIKAKFALSLLSAFPDREETKHLREYLRHIALKTATSFIEGEEEEAFQALLNLDLFTENALRSLLETANKLGRTAIAAYLMNYRDTHQMSTRKSAFLL